MGSVELLREQRACRLAPSFGGILRLLKRQIPFTLVDGTGWNRILLLADTLPAYCCTGPFGFELRLGSPQPEGDLLLSVPKGSSFARQLVKQGAIAVSEDSFEACFGRLVAERENTEYSDGPKIRTIILEYDVIGNDCIGEWSRPAVFLLVDKKEKIKPSILANRRARSEEYIKKLHQAIGWVLRPSEFSSIRKLLARLPPDAYIGFVGAMTSRRPKSTRLNIRRDCHWDTPSLLHSLQWRGNIKEVQRMVSKFRHVVHSTVLAIDVGRSGIMPTIGVELFQENHRFTTNISTWIPTLEILVSEKLCLPSMFEGLVDFCNKKTLFTSEGVYLAEFGINHFKLVFNETGIYAKAYIVIHLYPLDLHES